MFYALVFVAWVLLLVGSTMLIWSLITKHNRKDIPGIVGVALLAHLVIGAGIWVASLAANTWLWGGPFNSQQTFLESLGHAEEGD